MESSPLPFTTPHGDSDFPKRSTVAPETPNPPLIVALLDGEELFYDVFPNQLNALRTNSCPVRVITTPAALDLEIQANSARAIYLADGAILRPENAGLLQRVVAYAESGGRVVAGGLFPAALNGIKAKTFFSAFGLSSWTLGTTHNALYEVLPTSELSRFNPSLPGSYTMNAVNIQGIDLAIQVPIYIPCIEEDDHEDEVDVYAMLQGTFVPKPKRPFEAPIIQVRVGEGSLAFVGDVDGEAEETTVVLQALFRLLDPQPTGPPTRSPKPFVLVLTFRDYVSDSVLVYLNTKVEVVTDLILSTERIADLMGSPDLVGILVSSAFIAWPTEAYLLSKVVEYVKRGGIVIFLDSFAYVISVPECRPFFLDNFGLDWAVHSSSYDNEYTKLNYKNAFVQEARVRTRNGRRAGGGALWVGKGKQKKFKFCSPGAHSMYTSNPDSVVFIPTDRRWRNYWDHDRKRYAGPVLFAYVPGENENKKGRVAFVGNFVPEDDFLSLLCEMMRLYD